MSDSGEFLKLQNDKSISDNLDDLDDLLAQLTAEELEELNNDFDPDNSLMPPSERMKPQTTKDPTGPYNRKKLIAFLEKKAKEEKDWEVAVPYVKKIVEMLKKKPATLQALHADIEWAHGEGSSSSEKTWKPKQQPKQETQDDEYETEWDEVLKQATEEELVDLAAVLGFHGMLNQTQFYASENDEKIESGGFSGIAKAEVLKAVPFEPPNQTNVEESLKKIQDNDSSLKQLNLNNIKNISHERLEAFCEALKTNTNLETLEMASVAMTDRTAKRLEAFCEALKTNTNLETLEMASVAMTDQTAKGHQNQALFENILHERLEAFCEALKTNTNLETLEMASVAMTDRTAKKLAEALMENKTLKNLNVESNFITGEHIVEILKAINKNQTVIEFRATNQKPEALGNKVETDITKLVEANSTLLRLGIAFEFPDARVRTTEKLQANYDQNRKKRVGDKGQS